MDQKTHPYPYQATWEQFIEAPGFSGYHLDFMMFSPKGEFYLPRVFEDDTHKKSAGSEAPKTVESIIQLTTSRRNTCGGQSIRLRSRCAVPSVDWERYQRSGDLYNLVDRIRERYPQTFAYFTDNDCPAEAILNVASKLNADMIIISAHDKGWIAKLLLYSDADDIARRSRTPVLVYRPKSKAKTKSPRLIAPRMKCG
jgi:hypothetical protein